MARYSRYFCVRKCFHKACLWLPGEILEAKEGEWVPHQFVPEHSEAAVVPVKAPDPEVEPRTFSEFNQAQAPQKHGKKQR